MKIVLCKGQFMGPISGADESLVTYATQLKRAGHQASVLTLYPHPSAAQYEEPLKEAGVEVLRITDHKVHVLLALLRNATRRLSHFSNGSPRFLHKDAERITRRIARRYVRECHDYFHRSRADIVHVLTPDAATPVLIDASNAANVPVIYQEMGTPYYSAEHEPYYERLIESLPLCAEIAALSPKLANLCRDRYRTRRPVSVLPIMVEDMRNGHATQATRETVTFGFAARFDAMKGPLNLIKAFASIDLPSVRLRMAGAGPQASQIENQTAELRLGDRCDLPGAYTNRKQKTAFYASLDVFVLPSLAEGTPNCVIEAMSFGLPVIASSVGGVPEVVTPDVGILVAAGDELALAAAMRKLAENKTLRLRMGQAARERYEKLFTPDAVLPMMIDTYRRAAQRKVGWTANASDVAVGRLSASLYAHSWLQAEHVD
jgi:glycosyltransferase involved in cell wall biosynthesis